MSNLPIVFNFFKLKGLSDVVACAIIGNLQQESSPAINPSLRQSNNGPGRGIAQWEISPHGARFTALEKFAASHGTAWDCLETQLKFMWSEMTTRDISDRMKGKATNWNDNGAFQKNLDRKGATALPNGFEDFIKMTDLEQAVRIFDAVYHRSGTPRMERRIEFAQEAMKTFGKAPLKTEAKPKECTAIQIGSVVKLRLGAEWMLTPPKKVPGWAMDAIYRVDKLAGQRAVLNTDGINSPIDIKWLQLVE